MDRPNYLFSQFETFMIQGGIKRSLQEEIAAYYPDKLLNTNVDDLTEYFVQKFSMETPVLNEDSMTVDQKEIQIDVSNDPSRVAHHMQRGPVYVTGTEITLEVPFAGDPSFFNIRPSTFNSMAPLGKLSGNHVVFQMKGDQLQPSQVNDNIQQWLSNIKQHLKWHEDGFRGFNETIERDARLAIDQRRAKLLQSQNLVSGLGISLKRRPNSENTYVAPEIKRKLAPKMPLATPEQFKPEPLLEEYEYQHILSIIENMSKTMERDPSAYYSLGEENIRTQFLVNLNGHYQGSASGETFNFHGKTDIIVRSGDRNIFIAECKFWGGAVQLTSTITQLLGYLSWRDSKAAVIIFNRNKNLSSVLSQIPAIVEAHPNYKSSAGQKSPTSFRYRFSHKDDPAKVIVITVMAFDVPQLS